MNNLLVQAIRKVSTCDLKIICEFFRLNIPFLIFKSFQIFHEILVFIKDLCQSVTRLKNLAELLGFRYLKHQVILENMST